MLWYRPHKGKLGSLWTQALPVGSASIAGKTAKLTRMSIRGSLTEGQKVNPGNPSLQARMSTGDSLRHDRQDTPRGTAEGLSPMEPKWALRTQDPVQAQLGL